MSVVFVQKVPVIMPVLFIAALGLNLAYNLTRIFYSAGNRVKYTKNVIFDALFLLLIGSLVVLPLTKPLVMVMIALVGVITVAAVGFSIRKGVKEEITIQPSPVAEDKEPLLEHKYADSHGLVDVCNEKMEALVKKQHVMQNSSLSILYSLEMKKLSNKISAIREAKQYLRMDDASLASPKHFDSWMKGLPRSTFHSFSQKHSETEQLLEAVRKQVQFAAHHA